MPIMLLRRDVMVGFLGFNSASAAACTLLAPEWRTACGSAGIVSACECTEDAVEPDADGDTAGLPVVLGGLLLAGAAIFLAFCATKWSLEVQRVDDWDVW
jgi:hypothetical protein